MLPQSALGLTGRRSFGWVAESLVMCCSVLDDWRKYGEPAIGVSRPACYWCSVLQGRSRIFGEEVQCCSECVDREFISDHSRALSQGTLFIRACKSNAQLWQTNPCLLAYNGKSTPFFQCALRTKLILPFLSFLTLTTFRIGLGARSYTTSRGPYLSGSYSTSSAGG